MVKKLTDQEPALKIVPSSEEEIADTLVEMTSEFLNSHVVETSAPAIKQACISLFEAEHDEDRAFITGNKSIQFNSRKAYAKFYQLSEHLRYTDPEEYKMMKKFIIDVWFRPDDVLVGKPVNT